MIRVLFLAVLALSSLFSFGQDAFVITTQPVTTNVCQGKDANLFISSSGNYNRIYQWQKRTSTTPIVVWSNVNNGGGYSNASITNSGPEATQDALTTFSINTSLTGSAGAGVYRCMISDGPSTLYSNAITITILPLPSNPTTTNGYTCTSGTSVVLNAAGATGTQTYQWYFGGKPINGETAATFATPAITGNTNYYVTINNGTCESAQVLAVAQLFTPPAAPTITNGSACGSSAVVLTAAGATNGQYRWYTVAGKSPIPGETNSTYTTPVLTGTTTYSVSIFNGTCESSRVTVTATINTVPAAPATTGSAACGPSALTLSATGASNGQYRWYTVSTGGSPIAGQTNGTYTTPSLNTSATYFVAINNGTCQSTRTSVLAQINTIPTAPTTTGNSSCVTPASLQLNASGGTNGQYRWWISTTATTSIAGQTNSSYTTPLLSATTTYYVSVDNGTCGSARIPVVAQINSTPVTPTATGSAACGASALTMSAAGGTNGQYRWYTSSSGGSAIAGQTNSTYVTPSLTTSTTYYVAINNGSCESPRTGVIATINPVPATPTATGGLSCVTPASVQLNASGGTNGQYRWWISTTAKTSITGQTSSSYTTPLLSATTTYYVSLDNGSCESARTPVTAEINTPPPAPATVSNSLCAPGRVALSATGANDGQYRWYTSSTGGQPIAGEVNGDYLTPSLTTTSIFYVAINDGKCESTIRTPATATIGGAVCNNAPVIEATPITAQIEGKVTLDLVSLVSDADKNLDLNTLKVIVQPASGASASITTAYKLIIDYSNTPFSGVEYLTIEVCDLIGACTQKQLSIEVAGDIIVYNAISPGNDGKNDIFLIKYIDLLTNTQKNHVYIYSRWGDVIFDVADYDNTTKVFKGLNNSGNEIPSGTYFYKIEFSNGQKPRTGYLTLKR